MAKLHTSLWLLIPAILCVVFAISTDIARAEILISQTVSSASIGLSGDASHSFTQTLGQQSGKFISSFDVTAKYNQTSETMSILSCDNSNYATTGTCTNSVSHPATPNLDPSDTKLTQHFNVTTPFDGGSQYLYLMFSGTGAAYAHTVYGSATDLVTGGCFKLGSGFYSACSGVADLYVVLYSADLVAQVPQIYDITTPIQFQVTSSNYVPVSFSYLNTTAYDTVGLQVIDHSNASLLLNTGERSASQTGLYTFTNTLSLSNNHAYRVRGYLKDSTGSLPTIYGSYRDFSTVSDQFFTSSSTLINIVNINDSNATSTIERSSNSFSLFVRFFSDRVPFGWLWEVGDVYRSAATTSSQFAGVTFDYSDSHISTNTRAFLPGSLEVLSTTSVTRYLSPSLLSLFNSLVSAMMYVGTMAGVFFRIKGLTFNA